MADSVDIATAWHLLEISGIVQSVLCALWGVYFSLFVLALWATHGKQDVGSTRLRVVTIVLFINLCAHFISRSLQFARSRITEPDSNEFFKWGIPLTVIGNVTTTFAGLCSDGLLAWRFHVIFNRKKWALYIPGVFVVINALLCWSADAQHLAAYHHYDFYENTLLEVTLQITVAWGWLMFTINTLLTGAIVAKILITARNSHSAVRKYETVIRACVESALVTWIGLLVYEICSLAPNGHVVTNYDVGYVMACVIPVFFGISQCLIVMRVALSNEMARHAPPGSGVLGASTFRTGTAPSAHTAESKTVSFGIESGTHVDKPYGYSLAAGYVRAEEHPMEVMAHRV
ncbi:unnamed protein product [Somion occarium]|uniref:Uncharacterized protein n=1 Tax=Somion occarium TaxID=3059160 RepID=A0ABP1D385_9APHY